MISPIYAEIAWGMKTMQDHWRPIFWIILFENIPIEMHLILAELTKLIQNNNINNPSAVQFRMAASESVCGFEDKFAAAVTFPINNKCELDKWVYRFHDLLTRIFTYDSKQRIKPNEAIEHPFFELVKKKNFIQRMFTRIQRVLK